MRVCVRVCVRACVRACVCVNVPVCACLCFIILKTYTLLPTINTMTDGGGGGGLECVRTHAHLLQILTSTETVRTITAVGTEGEPRTSTSTLAQLPCSSACVYTSLSNIYKYICDRNTHDQ